MTERIEIRNGRVVTPEAVLDPGQVLVVDGRIRRVESAPYRSVPGARTIDAEGRIVLPGLIDLHGDDLEKHLAPRVKASVDPRTAIALADRENLANGVTTKYHAVAFEDAPGENRSIERAKAVSRALRTGTKTIVDNRLHARCELTKQSVRAVHEVAEEVGLDLLSIMHHEPGTGQFDRADFERHYSDGGTVDSDRVREHAESRQSISEAALERRSRRLAALASEQGVLLASHDDETPADVTGMADIGASISEFPVTERAANRAKELGLATVMGAPNLLRGGSLYDNLAAERAIERDLLDVLSSDYHPHSLLAAPFVETGEPLPDRVNRVTRTPADIIGLPDRGRIEVDARADLIIVDPEPPRTVETVLVAGKEVFRAGRHVARAAKPIVRRGS